MIEGHLYTEGVVKDSYLEEMKAQIAALPVDAEIIIHHIKSPGGSVYAAWKTIPELLKIGKPIKSMIEGEASSIASWIAVAPATSVEATDPSTAMIHEPFFPDGITGALGVDDLETAKTELDQIRMSMAEAYAKKSGKPVDYWLAVMKKNTRLTAQMLKAEGLVDKITMTEPRRIAAEVMDVIKNDLTTFKNEIMNLFGRRAVASAPIAVDLPLKDGKMLNVQSENGDLVGKPATIDGQPANGSYPLQDGRTVTCTNGIVGSVTDATTPPQETEAQRLARELQAAQSKLAAIEAQKVAEAKAAEEAAKAAADVAKQAEMAKALEEANAKIKALESQPVGKQSNPNQTPVAAAGIMFTTPEEKMKIMASRTWIADNFPQWEAKYPSGKFKDGTSFQSYRTGQPNAVSILETNLSYTWNGVLSLDLFNTPTLNSPAMNEFAMIDTGAKDSKRYHFLPAFSKVLKPYTGCAQAVTGSTYDITDKKIQLKPFQMYEGWCKDDFTNQLTGGFNVFAQEWLKDGNESFDPAGTPIDRFIVAGLKDALRIDTFRRIMFGDTASSSADWNQIDGYWQNLIDQSGASNYCVYRYPTSFGIAALAAGVANTYLAGVYNGSSLVLRQEGILTKRAKFYVTQSIWDNYFEYLAGVGAVTEQQYQLYLNGTNNLTFRGIPVIPVPIWDSFLNDSTNPLYNTTRHLISLTVKENHVIGVENTADLGKIDSWFEKKDQKRYYRSNMIMGFLGALNCDMTSIGY